MLDAPLSSTAADHDEGAQPRLPARRQCCWRTWGFHERPTHRYCCEGVADPTALRGFASRYCRAHALEALTPSMRPEQPVAAGPARPRAIPKPRPPRPPRPLREGGPGNGRPLTFSDRDLRAAHARGLSLKEIGAALSISHSNVSCAMKRLGLKPHGKQKAEAAPLSQAA